MTERSGTLILVINPGSTSTKVALFRGEVLWKEAILPGPGIGDIWEEYSERLDGIVGWLQEEDVSLCELDGIVGRGGLLRPLEGGTYRVTARMLADARANLQGTHASNLGCALAHAIAEAGTREKDAEGGVRDSGVSQHPIPAFVVDPVSTDEFIPLARFSGIREISRNSLSHALSIHAVVREVCRREGRGVDGTSFVVAHLGGGISVCPVRDGRILDANNAISGGPFSPSRAGGLPTQELLDLAFSGDFTLKELKVLTAKNGGLLNYLGTDDAREVELSITQGNGEARAVYEAMAYQIAKEIGAMTTVLKGDVDRIILTGGLASSELLMKWIRERIAFLASVEIFPEVEEMKALALGGLRILLGEEDAKEY